MPRAIRTPRMHAPVAFVFAVLLLAHAAVAHCPNHCSGHGRCNNPMNVCECDAGWISGDCSQRQCPFGSAWADEAVEVDDAHRPAECSNRGECDRITGTCKCASGFTGRSCERLQCPNECNGHGSCQSMRYRASLAGFRYSVWDADMIHGCVCDEGYSGHDCSRRVCPTGDDPFTTGQVNERQLLKCTATGGYFTLAFRGATTVPIAAYATDQQVRNAIQALRTVMPSGVNILFSGGSTACTADGSNIITVEFTQNFGDLPALVPNTQNLQGSPIEVATNGAPLDGILSVRGSKENDQCSGRGRCDTLSGYCICYNNYVTSNGYGAPGTRGDCGAARTVITSCPGEIACSGHGVCSGPPQYKCACAAGWTGGDCSERSCPLGHAWFDAATNHDTAHGLAECSRMGLCDRVSGQCMCRPGFEGSACERMSCPFGQDAPCTGHGMCLSMSALARMATDNGMLMTYTYGASPNDPFRWDHNKVQGCKCDPDFEGHNCALRTCPTGNDPKTGGVKERQVFVCSATGGTFRVEFRSVMGVAQLSPAISHQDTAAALKAKLESMSTIGRVSVELFDFDNPTNPVDTMCTSGYGHKVIVTFETELGDVPDMRFHLQLTGASSSITLFSDGEVTDGVQSVRGTMDNSECSDRGLCDHTSGTCSCFVGYGSSDSSYGPGTRGDCGYLVPFSKVNDEVSLSPIDDAFFV